MKLRNCRICGKKGVKFASDGCKICGADWVSDTRWSIAKKEGLTDGKKLRKLSNTEKTYRSIKDNIPSSREFVGLLFGFGLIGLIAYAFFSPGPDPYVHGCVHEKTYGAKISCVEFEFNEAKEPGSYEKAFQACMSTLKQVGKSTVKEFEIIGCVSSLGPYN